MLERYVRLLAPKQTLARTPGWSFDAPATRDDLGTFTRRAIWTRYRNERIERPVEINWCDGLRLRLRLGNDVSWSVFVGGMYEPNELAFMASTLRVGMTVVDVGANEGLFSLIASSRVGKTGRVLALEPSERELAWLRSNIDLNRLSNVESFELALYDRKGSASLIRAEFGHEGLNTIGDRISFSDVGADGTEIVQLETLDAFVVDQGLARLDFVKLDAEGSEVRILEGGQATVRRFLPIVLMEIGTEHLAAHGSTVNDLLAILADLDYRVWIFDRSGFPRLWKREVEPLSSNVVAAPSGVALGQT